MAPPPPLLLVAFVVLEVVLSVVLSEPRLLPPVLSVVGAAPLLLGVWLHVEAERVFSDAGTTRATRGVPARLVTRGVYGRSRNPMYLGGALFLVGLSVALGPAVTLAIPLLYLLLVRLWYVGPEEALLEERFGPAYVAYRKRVRRWI